MKKIRSIMVQGTMSNVGKSLITAGLCRLFTQDGYKVAPFKSQNMALNSYITEDSLEMGRAQVVQAEACKRSPTVQMNPILLKPTTDIGSQVIVNGKVIGNMMAKDYFNYKKELIPDILNAYDTLAKDSDIIVIEGAGSPAEINLKKDDIVNMGLAKMVESSVLLVGDIDRGGVFAQLYGTIALLEPSERDLIKGMIINKFRGDISILNSGLRQLETLCRKPMIGVVPYTHVDIDDEDSLSERLKPKEKIGLIDIVVIRYPHLSNFTDFVPLENIEGVSLRYVSKPIDFRNPSVVILSGTKNTISDTLWLRETGLETIIKKYAFNGGLIFGICGGYQMLGKRIVDSYGIEHKGDISALGLLDLVTTLQPIKKTVQTTSKTLSICGDFANLSNITVTGYEIHCGITDYHGKSAFEDSTLGSYDGNIFGTYLHGIFENDAFRNAFIELLFKRNGISTNDIKIIDYRDYKDRQYNLLADVLRNSLDIERLYDIIA